ncbi:MAG: tRNA 4-thiouridine(8) synthase ThiI [Patescibacteria group bacterium]
MKKQVKALVLLSGGLDSILAVKLLLEQGIAVETINFRTNFCGPSKARPAAQILGVPLREVNIREDFLLILKNPKHGYGAGLNPCIDCHALMLKKAGEIMREENSCPERSRRIDFIATGEVLGERPMSQHKQALDIVAKDADLKGYLLRPLSAKLLEPTIAEQKGLVDRAKLLDISGRSRKRQMALAKKYGVKEYPTPAGGCALTQKGFSDRLRELMKHKPDFNSFDVDLVRFGRHFFYPELVEGGDSLQVILGRNQEENEILASLARPGNILIEPDNWPGPTALMRFCHPEFNSGSRSRNEFGMTKDEIVDQVKELILQFSPKAKNFSSSDPKFKLIKK